MLKNQKGASLVEIMIALLIFGIGISMAMRLLPESNSATTRGRNLTKATNLAQEKIEELMGMPFGDTDLDDGAHADAGNPIQNNFTRSWNVAEDTPATNMKSVTVSVSFPTASTDSVAVLTSIITNSRR